MQKLLFFVPLFYLGFYNNTTAQELKKATLKGKLILSNTTQPAADIQVALPKLKVLMNSGANGEFEFYRVPFGTYDLVLGVLNPDTLKITVGKELVVLNDITLDKKLLTGEEINNNTIPTISMEENFFSAEDDGVKMSSVSSVLSAGRDPFIQAATFIFSPNRFQMRGYDRNEHEVTVNGALMNDIETGDAHWSEWGGVNEVFKSKTFTYGLNPSEYSFGGLIGSTNFNATAAAQRKQTKIGYSLANRSYRDRLTLTKSSGLMRNGWAYSFSFSRRWANEGYFPGTLYNGLSYYAAISKKISNKSLINLTAFGAPTERGKVAPATDELYDLSGSHQYNPNWGWQTDGTTGTLKKRNSKINNTFVPTFILNHEYTPNDNFHLNTSIAYQQGKIKNSGFDWYNASDPRAIYYRYLPSYALLNGDNDVAAQETADYKAHPEKLQVQWNNIYQANYAQKSLNNPSSYVISNDVDETKKFTINTQFEKILSPSVTIMGGAAFSSEKIESYKQIKDLLGGLYFGNINQFALSISNPTAPESQYDLNNPNRKVVVGDKYNYDYISRFNKAYAWAQMQFSKRKIDGFISVKATGQSMSREGLFRNGLFPTGNVSFGKSDLQSFYMVASKAGLNYKINGRNYLFANIGYSEDAPTFDNSFISPRTRNQVLNGIKPQTAYSFEAGYIKRSPIYNIRIVGYVTDIKDETKIKRYYDDIDNSFVNTVMQNLNTRYIGTEIAAEAKLSSALSVFAVAALGQSFYTNNPDVSVYVDNNPSGTSHIRESYIKNYYLAAGPQTASTLGFKYRSKKFWYGGMNFNYFNRNFVDISPVRRTTDNLHLFAAGTDAYNSIINQEKLPAAFTVDLNLGKSFMPNKWNKKIGRNTLIYFNVGISNLLDNKNMKTGGFEQLRFDDLGRVQAFPNKYFYGMGRNFFMSLSLKF